MSVNQIGNGVKAVISGPFTDNASRSFMKLTGSVENGEMQTSKELTNEFRAFLGQAPLNKSKGDILKPVNTTILTSNNSTRSIIGMVVDSVKQFSDLKMLNKGSAKSLFTQAEKQHAARQETAKIAGKKLTTSA